MAQQREQAADDALLTRIGQIVMLHHAGDREEARDRLLGLWAEVGEDGDPLHRCTLAHYLADTHADPSDELAWDLRALSAADSCADEPSPALRALYPSLHLNLAQDYVKLARPGAARSHLVRARTAAAALGGDRDGDGGRGYAAGVRAALVRVERQVAGLSGAGSAGYDEEDGEDGDGGGGGGRAGGEPLGPPRSGS
ncbi:hypothetical protein [Streptomyces sp. VRA16 Mangrove soil]|uniref:hypothetical protein n=1 Tax=Streptomyces sp. VRA16 Mangrove soil TaxID=2817434 RepID=UPI001A9CD713|nr:hypothetical protein [Streptomyces sp. VRA16 Mangrove soil]MBO1337285.1 hypothetical protein [Streptomyces sp. VRA16 Mangrove soil]